MKLDKDIYDFLERIESKVDEVLSRFGLEETEEELEEPEETSEEEDFDLDEEDFEEDETEEDEEPVKKKVKALPKESKIPARTAEVITSGMPNLDELEDL